LRKEDDEENCPLHSRSPSWDSFVRQPRQFFARNRYQGDALNTSISGAAIAHDAGST
jgi:hypothetical protein